MQYAKYVELITKYPNVNDKILAQLLATEGNKKIENIMKRGDKNNYKSKSINTLYEDLLKQSKNQSGKGKKHIKNWLYKNFF